MHELRANFPDEQLPKVSSKELIEKSPVKYNEGYDKLTPTQQEHAWFTAKYIENECYWRTVAFNPSNKIY